MSLNRCGTTPFWCMVTQFQGSLLNWNKATEVDLCTSRSDVVKYATRGATAPDWPNKARLPVILAIFEFS